MDIITIFLLLLALVCFVLGAIPINSRFNLMSLGLALWVLAVIINNPLLHR